MILDKVFRGRIHHGSLVVELPDGGAVYRVTSRGSVRRGIDGTASTGLGAGSATTDPLVIVGIAVVVRRPPIPCGP